jgi:membrane fusion protein (multidrug efflux system)
MDPLVTMMFEMSGFTLPCLQDGPRRPKRLPSPFRQEILLGYTKMNAMTGKSLIRASLCCILLIFTGACSPSEKAENTAPPDKPVPVIVTELRARDLPSTVETVGRLAPNREVTLATEVGGRVKEYSVDVGDRVETGQRLVSIDPRDYLLALEEARANIAVAQARLEAATKAHDRSKALLPQKAISRDTYDKYEAEYKSSKASLAQIRALVDIVEERVKKTRIKAPFSGLVAARLIEKGQTVGVGTPVMTLVDLDVLRARIHVAECDYVRVDRDDPVMVTVEAFPEKSFKGRIDRIGVKADERTNTFDVEILIDNPDLFLKAGLTARVRITTDVTPDTLLIPQRTVLYREDRREVFVAGRDNVAERRTIKLGRTEGSLIQVLEGLEPGDRLIVTGGQYLKPGDKITLAPSEEAVTR